MEVVKRKMSEWSQDEKPNIIQLSTKALKDLKIALKKSYGEDFVNNLTDEEVEHIGLVCLIILAEGLKLEMKE